jgi:hypothetical protein
MPRKCTICSHAERIKIEKELLNNVLYREIASKYDISEKAIGRHFQNHIKPAIEKANKKAVRKIVYKITQYRQEINYSSLNKVKLIQNKLLNDLESVSEIAEKIKIYKEFRGWIQEEAKISGIYTKEKENPNNITEYERAVKTIEGLQEKRSFDPRFSYEAYIEHFEDDGQLTGDEVEKLYLHFKVKPLSKIEKIERDISDLQTKLKWSDNFKKKVIKESIDGLIDEYNLTSEEIQENYKLK